MEHILNRMQEVAQTYAEILSAILKVDVTIVDCSLRRIAGSGKLKRQLGQDISENGYIIRYAIREKQIQIIADPGNEGVCLNCPNRATCGDIFEIWQPILVGNNAIGVIGLVCFNQRQRGHILKNKELFLRFLDQFTHLLSLKAQEVIES